MDIPTPYLLFLGDAPHAKTARGVRDWRPELCVGQLRYPGSPLDMGLPDMTVTEAAAAGAKTLLIGAAPAGHCRASPSRSTMWPVLEQPSENREN